MVRDRRFGLMAILVVAPGVALVAFLLNFASLARWRPPVGDGARVVYVDQTVNGIVLGISHETVLALQGLRDVFATLAYRSEDRGRSPDAGPTVWVGEMVSGGYFELLGLQAMLGRPLVPSDDSPNASRSAVISQRLWRDVFGSDKDILGRTLKLSPAFTGARSEQAPTYTIVWVMPESASGVASPLMPIDYWVPMAARVGGLCVRQRHVRAMGFHRGGKAVRRSNTQASRSRCRKRVARHSRARFP